MGHYSNNLALLCRYFSCMDAILYYLVFTEDTNGTIIYINKSTMNELNNREQEQYAEPTTKRVVSKS